MTRIGETEITSRGEIPDSHNNGESVEKSEPNSIAAAAIRSSLGFLAARRRLVLPDVGLDEEAEKTGHLDGLAVVDRFGFVLLSCASGMRQHHLFLFARCRTSQKCLGSVAPVRWWSRSR